MSARKPTVLKLLANTARRDREVAGTATLPPIDTAPPPPAWMTNVDSRREWERLARTLTTLKLLHAGNLGLFEQMCALHGWLIQAWATGKPPTAALVATYRKLLGDLGLRSAMISPAPEKQNRFLKLRRP